MKKKILILIGIILLSLSVFFFSYSFHFLYEGLSSDIDENSTIPEIDKDWDRAQENFFMQRLFLIFSVIFFISGLIILIYGFVLDKKQKHIVKI